MRATILASLLGIGPLLSACQQNGPGDLVPLRPAPDTCGASGLERLIGTEIGKTDLSDHSALRIIPPGSAVTMDYNADRLNVEIDAAGIITRLSCG